MGYFWHLHVFGFCLSMQMLAGLLQSIGWPSVVDVIGNWFGDQKRGLIMGIWNAHMSVGNTGGSLLAAVVLEYGWGWSFILLGASIALAGVLVFPFLAAYLEDLRFSSPRKNAEGGRDEAEGRVRDGGSEERGNVIGFVNACLIPWVVPFTLRLFFVDGAGSGGGLEVRD